MGITKPKANSKGTARADQVTDHGLRQLIGYNLKRTFVLVRQDLIETLAPLELRVMTFSALSIIVENPDITQTQLSVALNIERSGVVVLVDELENADLISRNHVEGDRRSYALRATLVGQKTLKEAVKRVKAHEDCLFSDLSDEEREKLRSLLGRISKPDANN